MAVPVGVALWLGIGALTAKALKSHLKDQVLKGYQGAVSPSLTLEDIREIHYARNQSQDSDLSYADVLLGDYKRLSDGKSGLHQLGHKSNRDNSKWVSLDGKEEYVFKYIGSTETGGFELVTSDLNMGTYNYRAASDVDGHKIADVYTWLLWGNTKADAKAWGVLGRAAAGAKAFDDLRTEETFLSARGSRFDKVREGSNGIDGFNARDKVEKFKGGGGIDIVRFKGSDHAVAVSLKKGIGQGGTADFDKFISIENLMGSKFGDILIGDGKDNDLHGEGGRDTLFGLGGRNHLYGGDENDKIYGGSKKDVIEGGDGHDTIYGDYVLVGKPHGKDELYGGEGDDEIRGGGEKDTIDGQGGNDTLIADGGSDTLYGGKNEEEGEGNDTFIFEVKAASKAYGQDGDDTFKVKNGGGHILYGGDGDDMFILKSGAASKVYGGADNDTIVVKKGYNHFIDGGDGYDIVDLRGLELDRLDLGNFVSIDEVWVDEAFVTPFDTQLQKVVLYQSDEIVISPTGEDGTVYVMGGAGVQTSGNATLSVTFAPSLDLEGLRVEYPHNPGHPQNTLYPGDHDYLQITGNNYVSGALSYTQLGYYETYTGYSGHLPDESVTLMASSSRNPHFVFEEVDGTQTQCVTIYGPFGGFVTRASFEPKYLDGLDYAHLWDADLQIKMELGVA